MHKRFFVLVRSEINYSVVERKTKQIIFKVPVLAQIHILIKHSYGLTWSGLILLKWHSDCTAVNFFTIAYVCVEMAPKSFLSKINYTK